MSRVLELAWFFRHYISIMAASEPFDFEKAEIFQGKFGFILMVKLPGSLPDIRHIKSIMANTFVLE